MGYMIYIPYISQTSPIQLGNLWSTSESQAQLIPATPKSAPLLGAPGLRSETGRCLGGWPSLWKMMEFVKCHWIGLRENRKPWFLPSNIGLSCKFSHHPILWKWDDCSQSMEKNNPNVPNHQSRCCDPSKHLSVSLYRLQKKNSAKNSKATLELHTFLISWMILIHLSFNQNPFAPVN